MKISGARAIVECIMEEGIDTVFGYPGGVILPFYDALQDTSLRHILTVHEQGAAHAADGYARATGKTGVCVATSGPGATNLVTGLAAAYLDSVPVVAITGQVATNLIGQDAFQEVDITGITMPITKHNLQVKDPEKLVEVLRQAFRIAKSGRPGPVLVDVPRDVQTAQIEFYPPSYLAKPAWQPSATLVSLVQAAAEAINSAERPIIIAGGGVITADGHDEVRQLAEKAGMPVTSTLMGLGGFPASHHQWLGLNGMHGHKVANNSVHDADLIVAIGSRFSDRVTGDRTKYADSKMLIHIDVDPAEIDKNVAAHIGLAGEMKCLLNLLIKQVEPAQHDQWWECIKGWQEEFRTVYDPSQLTGPWIMNNIADQTAGGDFLFATDVGQHQMWAAQHLRLEKPRTWLTSGGLGAMGFGLPAAMGAQVALPEKRVIHIAGDGGFKMTGAELYTISSHNLPVISIVVNNNGLGMIRQLQRAFFNSRYTSCELPPKVDFTAFAAAFGVHGVSTNTTEEFAAAFAEALTASTPRLIVANIASNHMVTPMVGSNTELNEYIDLDE